MLVSDKTSGAITGMLLCALSIIMLLIPCSVSAIGDVGIQVEVYQKGGVGAIDSCPYCKKLIKVGNVQPSAGAIINDQLQQTLMARGIGYEAGASKKVNINVLIYLFEARKGGNYAVEKPANVRFHMHRIENNTVVRTFVFEEEQQPLLENVLNIGSFLKRGGKWLTATQLSEEGVEQGIKDLLDDMIVPETPIETPP